MKLSGIEAWWGRRIQNQQLGMIYWAKTLNYEISSLTVWKITWPRYMPSAYSLTDVVAEESWNSKGIVGCSFHTAVYGEDFKTQVTTYLEKYFSFYFKWDFNLIKAHMKQNTAYLCKIQVDKWMHDSKLWITSTLCPQCHSTGRHIMFALFIHLPTDIWVVYSLSQQAEAS